MTIRGKIWCFGDNINTDLMVPQAALYLPPAQQTRFVFAANRPGWTDLVQAGDIIVGGKNFGAGSARPAARSLRNLGVACLLAESLNGLFFRNAVNFGFLALECPGLHAAATEGEMLDVSVEKWEARLADSSRRFAIRPIAEQLHALMREGGVFPYLEKRGLIAPDA